MERLKPTERHFFSLVHQAVYANPFSDRRDRVDLEIAGFFADADQDRGFQKTISQVRTHLGRLEEKNRADITRYGEADRKLLTSSFLFDLFHRFVEHFDQLIVDQLGAGDRSLPVPRLLQWP